MSDYTEIAFNAIPKTVVCLEGIAETSGMTRTDVLNRSVQLYAYLTAAMATGDRLVLLHPAGDMDEVKVQ